MLKKYILVVLCKLFVVCSLTIYGQEKPNVLLIISDDLNTSIGPYIDIENHTPNLSRLAEEGIRFNRAYCQYPLCGPSRASLMSGLYPETNGVLTNQHVVGSYRGKTPSLSDHPTIAGFFRKQGYYTARVSKIFHMGVPGGIERGEAGDDDPDSWDYLYNVLGPETLSKGKLELLSPGNLHYGGNFSRMILKDGTENTQTDYIATSQAIAILESRAGQVAENATNKVKLKPLSPFFLAVGLVRPHVPLIAPENCFAPYPEHEIQIPEVIIGDDVPEMALKMRNGLIWKMNDIQKRQTISAYMASIRFMDQQVGRLMDALDKLNLKDNTIVVFISDHGYNLGEHDCWAKSSLWEGTVRVPMIISYPDNKNNHGITCETVTELIDLYPTLSELCGLSDHQPEILQGKSYARYIKDDEPIEQESFAYTVAYNGSAASIRTEEWRYTRWVNNSELRSEELYYHVNDPEELNNLAYKPKCQNKLVEMRKLLESYK
ncbi:MAG: sulfatase [Bacteroidota bacterium]